MNTIEIECPECRFTGRLPSERVGRRVRCPECRTRFRAQPEPPPDEPVVIPEVDIAEDVGPQKWPRPGWRPPIETLIPLLARLSLIAALLGVIPILFGYLNPLAIVRKLPEILWIYLSGGLGEVLVYVFTSVDVLVFVVAVFWARRWLKNRGRGQTKRGGVYGTADWATEAQLTQAQMVQGSGLVLGRLAAPTSTFKSSLIRLITAPLAASDSACRDVVAALTRGRLGVDRGLRPLLTIQKYVHLLTIAPTGAGKGVGVIITNLLTYEFSCVVVDPKGENARITAEFRCTWLKNDVFVLDPWGISGFPSASFNPFSLLDKNAGSFVDDVKVLGNSLVVRSGKEDNPHWDESAAIFITAIIMFVACEAEGEERSLNTVRSLLTNLTNLKAVILAMQSSAQLNGLLARYGDQMAAIPSEEFGSILSSANRHLSFLDSPLVADLAKVLRASGHADITDAAALDRNARTQALSGYLRLSRDAISAAGWLKRYVEAFGELE